MAGSAELEIVAPRTKFHRFMVRKWRILDDSPDSELATPHQRIPLFLMYLEIQVLAGFPELEIATSAIEFRRFGAPGNPIFGDFREQVPAFWWSAI